MLCGNLVSHLRSLPKFGVQALFKNRQRLPRLRSRRLLNKRGLLNPHSLLILGYPSVQMLSQVWVTLATRSCLSSRCSNYPLRSLSSLLRPVKRRLVSSLHSAVSQRLQLYAHAACCNCIAAHPGHTSRFSQQTAMLAELLMSLRWALGQQVIQGQHAGCFLCVS